MRPFFNKSFLAFIMLTALVHICSPIGMAERQEYASDTIDNPRLSDIKTNRSEISNHYLILEATTTVSEGNLLVVIPASSTTTVSNDGLPDGGTDIIDSGFDLNRLRETDIICDGGDVSWSRPEITLSEDSKSGEHEIKCPFGGTVNVDDLLTMRIGSEEKGLVNPVAITNHKLNQADTYHVDIRLTDNDNNVLERLNTQVALIEQNQISGGIGITTHVGVSRFSLFGYTSPYAQVNLNSATVTAATTSDKDGYFVFRNLFAPYRPEEACLFSTDTDGIVTHPICIPPFPVNKDTSIGPVLMPPSISVTKGSMVLGENTYIRGKSIPNIEVNLSFFNASKARFNFIERFLIKLASISPIKSTYALSLSPFNASATKLGNYEIALSGYNPAFYNAFTAGKFRNTSTPKSFTIQIEMLPWWLKLIRGWIPLLPVLFILLLVPILFLYFKRFFHPHSLSKQRALARRNNLSLELEPHQLLNFHDKMLLRLD